MARVEIEINNLTKLLVNKKFLIEVARKTISTIGAKFKPPFLSIVLVDNSVIKKINKRYRGRNKVTDVLAFNYGEIVICVPQAKKQAKELKHSLKKELGILLIQGILHLSEQKDRTQKEFNKMNKKQEQIWQKIISL